MGATVIVRDYAVGDHAQLRFAPESKIGENLYRRWDGTTSLFFSAGLLLWQRLLKVLLSRVVDIPVF